MPLDAVKNVWRRSLALHDPSSSLHSAKMPVATVDMNGTYSIGPVTLAVVGCGQRGKARCLQLLESYYINL